jgi:hypothetical protein
MANVAYESGNVAINLVGTWEKSLKQAKKCRNVSMVAMFHQYLLLNMLHELHHLITWNAIVASNKEMTDEDKQEEEELAEAWADKVLDYLAQSEDMEPDHPANSKFLGRMVMDELKASTKWAASQRELVAEHIYYRNAKSTMVAMSFKRYMQIISKDPHSIEWEKDSIVNGVDPDEYLIIDMSKVGNQYQAAHFQPAQPAPVVQQVAQAAEVTQSVIPTPETYFDNLSQPAAPTAGFSPASFPVEDDFDVDAEVERRFGSSAPATKQQAAPVAPPQPAPAFQQMATAAVPAAQHTPEQAKALMFNVFAKCYNQIFGKCQPHAQGFNHPEGVHIEPVKLTAEEMLYVKAVDCLDANGRWCPRKPTTDGEIRGLIMKNLRMPYFKLYIEYAGHKVTRVLLPQNPQKQNNGQFSKPALDAQAGHAIMYVKDGDTDAWIAKLVDGNWA